MASQSSPFEMDSHRHHRNLEDAFCVAGLKEVLRYLHQTKVLIKVWFSIVAESRNKLKKTAFLLVIYIASALSYSCGER